LSAENDPGSWYQRCQFIQIVGIHEFQNTIIIGKVTNHPLLTRTQSPNNWCQGGSLILSSCRRQAIQGRSAKYRTFFSQTGFNVSGSLFDDFQAVQVTFVGGVSPGK